MKNVSKVCDLFDEVQKISDQVNSIKRGFDLVKEREKKEKDWFDEVMKERGCLE